MAQRIDEVTERLLTALVLGEYLPGQRLPAERDLAERLGVGRMTVRSALAELGERGMIDTVRGRSGGSFVSAGWTPAGDPLLVASLGQRIGAVREVTEAVGRLEGTVARAAAEEHTTEEAALLRELLERFRDAESGAPSQAADARLHEAIAQAAHSPTLHEVLREVAGRVSLSAPAHVWGLSDGMRDMELRALREHELLVEAIVRRDGDAAERLARAHNQIDIELFERTLAVLATA